MRRREFIALAGGVAAWPPAARAPQSATPVIGYLSSGGRQGRLHHSRLRSARVLKMPAMSISVAIEYGWAEEVFLTARVAWLFRSVILR